MAEIKDKVITVESLNALHEHNKSTYMTKDNPTGTGTLTIDSIVMGNARLEYQPDGILRLTFVDETDNG